MLQLFVSLETLVKSLSEERHLLVHQLHSSIDLHFSALLSSGKTVSQPIDLVLNLGLRINSEGIRTTFQQCVRLSHFVDGLLCLTLGNLDHPHLHVFLQELECCLKVSVRGTVIAGHPRWRSVGRRPIAVGAIRTRLLDAGLSFEVLAQVFHLAHDLVSVASRLIA